MDELEKRLRVKKGNKMNKRVVVTGIGVICPSGNNLGETWDALLKGKCAFSQSKYPQVHFYGEVDHNYSNSLSKKEIRYMDKTSQFAVLAAREAVGDSKLDIEKEKAIICIGSAMGGMETLTYEIGESAKEGMNKITVLGMPKLLSNMISSNISIDFGISGGAYTYNSACASSAIAFGEAYKKLQYGEVTVALAGGAESCIVEQVFASFLRLGAISQSDDIDRASLPFSKHRAGFVLSEGAAILVLEEYEHAVARNANIYAEVLGYGTSSDARSLVAPNLEGIKLCINRALEDAQLCPEEIEYINAHGTGTQANDVTEGRALSQIFRNNPYVSSSKSMHGHLLGAAGALEIAVCCMMIKNNVLLPQINVAKEDVDDELRNLNLLLDKPIKYSGKPVMTNSFGFGGDNASIILGHYK